MAVCLGLDVGKVRIGVAKSDSNGILASALPTLPRVPEETALDSIANIAIQEGCEAIFIGYPLNLRAEVTESTRDAIAFARLLSDTLQARRERLDRDEAATRQPAPPAIRLIDERLTSALVHGQMRELGKSNRQARQEADSRAAMVILQTALDSGANRGQLIGLSLEEMDSDG